MTRSQQILTLYDGTRTTREIADIVGCRIEYVRVVARQRAGRSYSEIDERYKASSRGRATLDKATARANARNKLKRRAYYKVLYDTGDREAARAAFRAAPIWEAAHA
jgi:hypothetical protein